MAFHECQSADAVGDLRSDRDMKPTSPPAGTSERDVRGTWSQVVLIGLMATGKTVVGEELARRLGVQFHDNDRQLAEAAGLTPAELRARHGVAALHALEVRILLGALRIGGPRVISAAASVVETDAVRSGLRNPDTCAIWLRGTPATLAARFHNEAHRPAYADDLEEFFEHQIATRAPLFLEVSDAVVDIDKLSVEEVVEHTLAIVRGYGEPVHSGES